MPPSNWPKVVSGRPDARYNPSGMNERYDSVIGGLIGGVGLVVLSLWYWASAPSFAADSMAAQRGLIVWAVRLAASAGVAAAQILLMTYVVPRVFYASRFDLLLRVAASVVFSMCLAGAVALALLATLGGSQ